MAQIDQFNPPPNPAKTTDSRYESYRAQYGDESWELDALDPRTLRRIITAAVDRHTDAAKRAALVSRQEDERQKLLDLAEEGVQ